MKQPSLLLVVALLLMGCQRSSTAIDPFAVYGPRRAPPPPTGALGQPDTYYQPSAPTLPALPPAGSQAPRPLLQPPPPDLAPQENRTSQRTPGEGSESQSESWQRADAATDASTDSASAHPASAGRSLAQRMKEGANLRWGNALPSMQGSVRQASATVQMDASVGTSIASTSPSPANDADGTNSYDAHEPRGDGAGEVPRSFSPQSRLVEITQLPPPGYTPSTFNPLAHSANAASAPSLPLPPDRTSGQSDPSGRDTVQFADVPHDADSPGRRTLPGPAAQTSRDSTAQAISPGPALNWKRRWAE